MTRWTAEDRALVTWGNSNGHPVMVTGHGPVFVAECLPCDWEQRSWSKTAANSSGLAHLRSVRARGKS